MDMYLSGQKFRLTTRRLGNSHSYQKVCPSPEPHSGFWFGVTCSCLAILLMMLPPSKQRQLRASLVTAGRLLPMRRLTLTLPLCW